MTHPEKDQTRALDLDLQLAEKVYRTLLPKRLTVPGIDVVTRLRPFNRVGGDYATVFPTNGGRVYVCVSDVTSHGISSALLVTRINSFVREHVPSANHPCEVVEELNAFLCEHFGRLGMSLSFFCGTVDLRQMEFTYAGCGHPPALHFRASTPTDWKRLESQHTRLGIFPELSRRCRIDKVPLHPGDRILLYTDGLIEARNAKGELFEVDRLAQVVGCCLAQNLEGELIADRVFASVNEFEGEVCRDDALLMLLSL